jgi:hypothetical protein
MCCSPVFIENSSSRCRKTAVHAQQRFPARLFVRNDRFHGNRFANVAALRPIALKQSYYAEPVKTNSRAAVANFCCSTNQDAMNTAGSTAPKHLVAPAHAPSQLAVQA